MQDNQNWRYCTLGEAIVLQRGFDLPERERRPGNVPIVSSSGITGIHNIAKVQGPGVVTGRYGTLGEVFYIKEDFWPLNTTLFVRDFKGNNPLFISYFLKILNLAHQNAAGAVPGLNRNALHLLPIYLPPLSTQHKIAAILSAYDDLIENNTRRIAILEEIAQSIYQEWFVRFRYPGHEKDKLVESELGMIPEEWEMVKVTQAVDIDPYTKVPKDNEKPFVSMENLSSNSMVIKNIGYRVGNSGSKFKNGDTLFARITPCIENGKTGYVQFLASDGDVAFGSTEFIVLRSKTLCSEFVYLMARSNELRNHAIKSMSGSSGRQRVQRACFDNYSIAQPPLAVLTNFSETTSPMFRSIHILAQKNINLRRTRDLLLPKLISGEIDVEALDIDISDLIESKEQQGEPIVARPEPIDATQLALPLL